MFWILFCPSSLNGQKISYWYAKWNDNPPYSTSDKISGCSSEFRPILAEVEDLAEIEFWVFFSLNLKQHMISEYKEEMSNLYAYFVDVCRGEKVY